MLWVTLPKAATSAVTGNCCKKGGIWNEKHIGFITLDFSLTNWLTQALRTAPPTYAAQELLEGLGDLMSGSAESLMLELGEEGHELSRRTPSAAEGLPSTCGCAGSAGRAWKFPDAKGI